MLSITAFYAALLAVLFLFLSVRVIGWRRERRVEFGHGDDIELLRRMRVHANFAEYVPFTLLLMALAESMAPPHLLLHLAGLHARRRGAYSTPMACRSHRPSCATGLWGMWLTFAALGLAAIICLSLSALFLAV